MEEENREIQENTPGEGEAAESGAEDMAAEETAVEPASRSEKDGEEAAIGDEDGDEERDDFEKLFSVPFTINVDELYRFQLVMAREQIAKNKKRSKIISIVEIVLGLVYFGAILSGRVVNGLLQYVLTFVLIALGVYGLLYYKYFFEKSLRKNVEKQHAKIPYFNTEIVMDIYPNKCVECFEDKETPNYWRKIQGIISSPDAYYIQLDSKRCLLIPKRCAGGELEPFLRQMCADFEKRWSETE